ncbi:sulfite exporter TauE/SafE family protein [Sulfurimonas sp. HSL3-2]|uniref:sulfite exporter TauE/SafE family protein n=1 Tax=Hydrocurvibacter mobilis TaxID=3131936 RepID=UPI0031F92B37
METVTFFSLFIIGLSYGSTACMFSCMPFLSPLLVKNSNSIRESVSILIPFSLGRIFMYTVISVMALSGAGLVKTVLNDNAVFQSFLGLFTLSMGLFMFYRFFKKEKVSCSANRSISSNQIANGFGLFGIGVLVSINPCAPILTLITLSANSTSMPSAIGMGLSFGLGAVLVPFLFYGFFLSTVIRGLLVEFKTYAKAIEMMASLLLVIVGILIISGQIRL